MLPVLRTRIEKPSHYKIGDKIGIPINGVAYTATATRREADGNMLFVMDTLLEQKRYIDRRNSTYNWKDCSLRRYLQKLYEHLLNKKIKNQIVPFEDGDYFKIPSLKDVKGDKAFLSKKSERIRARKTALSASGYWLSDGSVEEECFYYVDYEGTVVDQFGDAPRISYGVLIIFKLKDNFGQQQVKIIE